MRKKDKIKNIKQTNILAEQRYYASKNPILENSRAIKKTVFHGGKKILTQADLTNDIMYFSDDREFSEEYSKARHRQVYPKITVVNITITNPAPPHLIESLAKKLGINTDSQSVASILEEDGIVDLLAKLGYDGAIANDFGFRSDFEEIPVYVVFNAKKQVTVLNQNGK
jgi:hypothetical protein